MNLCKVLPIVFFILGILLLFGGYLGLKKLPEIQRSKVAKRLPFSKDGEITQKWKSNTDKGYLKMYLFNITNLDEYLNEEEDYINVNEVGPVVYSYKPNITILNWSEDQSTVTFVKERTFHFEPEMTKIDMNTTINSANIIAASIVDKVSKDGYFKRLIADPYVNTQFKKFNTSMFLTKTVDELLFAGYDISVLPAVNEDAAKKYPDNLYGLMHGKNYSNDGVWTMNTGRYDINKLGSMEKWEFVSYNNCWQDATLTCGHVIGTDGSRFHPGLDTEKKDKHLNLYSASLYRTLSMFHSKDYVFKGIKVARYEVEDTNFFLNLEHNKCYCPDKEKTINGKPFCDFNGLLDISLCRKAPIIISAPHFLYGTETLHDHVKGLKPDLRKHESYIDVDPVTGVALKGRKRLQINAYVRRHKTGHKNKDTVVPIMWIEEGQDITDEKAVLYYAAIHGMVDKATIALQACIVIGIVLIVASLVLVLINIVRGKNDKLNIKKNADINDNFKYHKAATMPLDEKIKMKSKE